MSQKITATHERGDDIPAIIVHLKKMRVAEVLDNHFPTNGNWEGLRLGWTTVVWLTLILSEGDHRRYRVEPWVKEHPRTLRRCIGRTVRPRDLADARLATVLDSLCVAERWGAFERARNQSVLRVSDVQGRVVRVDTTTAAAYVTPEGMFQLGHSKDHRPDLPQVKLAMAVLDPLGLPWTTTVVAGQTADDSLYLPEIATIRQIAGSRGLTSVGDCTMAAIGTRAAIVAHGDASLCPLSVKQRPAAALARVLDPVWRGALQPRALRVPTADGALDETADPVALGFEDTVERSALDHVGQPRTWQERRLVVCSLAFAARQEQSVRPRVARAVTESNALDERKQGKPRVPDETAASQAAAARVRAASEEAPLTQAVQLLGWRVYATNHTAKEMALAQGIATYRSEYLIEHGFGRLKGHALSLTPLFCKYDHRVVGLLWLLSIARRVLVLMQCVARRNLQQAGATLTGIYPGQPGRQTAQPTTELMLAALRGVTLSRRKIDGTLYEHLSPLHALQKRILALMEVP